MEKKIFLEKVMLSLKREILPTVLVAYGVLLIGMRWKGILDVHFWKLYKRDKVSCTKAKMDSIFALKELLKAWS